MADIRYTFTAQGQQEVVGAFNSIRAAANRTAQSVMAASKNTAVAQAAAAKRISGVAVASGASQIAVGKQIAMERLKATTKALHTERTMLRQMLLEYEGFEKRRTNVARREGNRRVEHERRNQRRAARDGGVLGGAGRFGGRVLRTAGTYMAMGAGFALAATAGSAIRENVRVEDAARDLAIRGRAPGQARVNSREIADQARRTALEVPGARTPDILEGMGAFLERTGDLKKAQEASKILAELSLATGASMEDLGASAAALFTQFGTGKDNIEDLREQLGVFVLQGKRGAFEMKDMAKGIERMAAAARVLGVQGDLKQVGTVGALAQFARRAAGGPERAVTSVEGAFSTMMRKRSLIKKRYGIDVGAEAQQDLASTLPKLFKAIGGNAEKLGNIFEKRAITGVIDLFLEFKKLEKQTGSQAKAAELLTAQIRDWSSAENASKEIALDLADKQQSAGARLDAAWERIVQAFDSESGKKALDSVFAGIEQLVPLAPAFAKAIGLFIEALSGAALGIAKIADMLGVSGPLKAMENERAASAARAEMMGQEKIAAGYKAQLALYGREVGAPAPEGALMMPEEAHIAELQRLYGSAESIRARKENELLGLVGGEKGLTPQERDARRARQSAEAEARFEKFVQAGALPAPGGGGGEAEQRVYAAIKGERERVGNLESYSDIQGKRSMGQGIMGSLMGLPGMIASNLGEGPKAQGAGAGLSVAALAAAEALAKIDSAEMERLNTASGAAATALEEAAAKMRAANWYSSGNVGPLP